MAVTDNGVVNELDHAERALSRLLEQYKDKPVITGLIKGLLTGSNNIETLLGQFIQELSLDKAVGDNLDLIGSNFNVARKGLDDERYRSLIFATIAAQNSLSTGDSVLSAFASAIDSDEVALFETYNHGTPPLAGVTTENAANYTLRGQVEDISQVVANLKELAQVAAPVGVGAVEVLLTDNSTFFQPSELTVASGVVLQRGEGEVQDGVLRFDDTLGDTGKVLYSGFGDIENTDSSLLAEISNNNNVFVNTLSWVYASSLKPSGLTDGSSVIETNVEDWSEVVVGATVELIYSNVGVLSSEYAEVDTITPTTNGWRINTVKPIYPSALGTFKEMRIAQLTSPTDTTGWEQAIGAQILEVTTNSTTQQIQASSPQIENVGVMLEVIHG